MTEPLLHKLFPEVLATLPFHPLGERPTPVRELTALSTRSPLWCKDESGFGWGGWSGNKIRKLEWILPDVLRRGSDTMLTVGGLGTNWGLAAALYGRDLGLRTVLALIDQPVDDHVRQQLDRLHDSGAIIHRTHTKARTIAMAPWLLLRHSRNGRLPYLLPAGGSSPIGVLGYVETALELAEQVAAGALPEPSHIVTAVGSGGTAAGLALGLRLAGLRTRVVGVIVNDTLPLDARHIVQLAEKGERLLRSRGAQLPRVGLEPGDITMVRDWLGDGYGVVTPEALAAQQLTAREGLDLEPVYTAKAIAGLLAMDARQRFGAGPVLFLNTYGPKDSA
ncbi:1-aminocyclopropane-1-carboxylate deaminase/D-cysteine desulfhydrase [Nocardia australiensis]|uniref:1-aminocyclopropane-1-carboxylate deaminase/D-cysteine desulfhydrase n=1 Tax=Nocardia australiensis TaxID=2887191 RepID=UPI001D151826|nr:pyridoxal-phosphate dependent enzyme [Nocardia australiensis]